MGKKKKSIQILSGEFSHLGFFTTCQLLSMLMLSAHQLSFMFCEGNLMRMQDGQLCYLDFGMMGQIDKTTRQALIRATLHLVNREFTELAKDLVILGFLPAGADKSVIVPALTGVPHHLKLASRTREFALASLK